MVKRSTRAAGIDTAKQDLDIALHPKGEHLRVPNSREGHRRLAAWLRDHAVERVGIEASGGYERAVVAHLRLQDFQVVLLQPRQVRAFAEFKLRRAKNDRIDAALIAECTASLDAVRPPSDARLEPLAKLLLFIEQIEADIVRLQCRCEHAGEAKPLAFWKRQIRTLQKAHKRHLADLRAKLQAHPDLAERIGLIESIDGIGQRTALALVVLLPELGTLNREQIACLAGLAPFDDDSGRHAGERHIAGGRARVRRALYNAALPAAFHWNHQLKDVYGRLTARHKTHKQALTACARKLLIYANTVCHRRTPWTKALPLATVAT